MFSAIFFPANKTSNPQNVAIYPRLHEVKCKLVYLVTGSLDWTLGQTKPKHTLKKKGRAFRNIGTEKYISLTVKSALLLYYLFYNLLLIRSFTTGSGTFILLRWCLLVQLLVFTQNFSLVQAPVDQRPDN